MPYYPQIQYAKFNCHNEKPERSSMYFLQFWPVVYGKDWKISHR